MPIAMPELAPAVHVAFLYMGRSGAPNGKCPPLRVGDGFLAALCRNINELKLPELGKKGEELELRLQALAIAAFSRKGCRAELCGRALDALEVLWPGLGSERGM